MKSVNDDRIYSDTKVQFNASNPSEVQIGVVQRNWLKVAGETEYKPISEYLPKNEQAGSRINDYRDILNR